MKDTEYFEEMTFSEKAEWVSDHLTAFLEPYTGDDEIREVPSWLLVEARMVIDEFHAEASRLRRVYRIRAQEERP